MTYKLTFTIREERKNLDGTPAEPYFYNNTIVSNDKNLEQDMEIARAYSYNDEVLVEKVPDPEPTIQEQIAELKAQLSSTDYKIIKCSEAQLVGEELPYDIVALHNERQAIRDKINELEGSVE